MERQGMQQRVQLAILREIHDQRKVGWPTMSVLVPHSDERDYVRALEILYNTGAIETPAALKELRVFGAAGQLTLTRAGQHRLDHD